MRGFYGQSVRRCGFVRETRGFYGQIAEGSGFVREMRGFYGQSARRCRFVREMGGFTDKVSKAKRRAVGVRPIMRFSVGLQPIRARHAVISTGRDTARRCFEGIMERKDSMGS